MSPKTMSCKKMGDRENKFMMVNRFRKLFTRYEKKAIENYLGLVQLSCSIIIHRKIILGYTLNLYTPLQYVLLSIVSNVINLGYGKDTPM